MGVKQWVPAVFSSALLAGGMICPAQATVVYDFTASTTTGSAGQTIDPFSMVLTLDSGFTPEAFSRACNSGCYSSSGNFADFSIAYYYGATLLGTLNNVPDSVFENTQGSLAAGSGSVTWDTSMNTISLTFANGTWSAHFNSDRLPNTCYETGCNASGTFAAVPEPGTLAVFGLGVAALLWRHRRNQHATA